MSDITIKTFQNREKTYRECLVCNNLFYLKPSLIDRRFTCSRICMGKLKIGKKLTEETRKKISASSIGKKGTNTGKKFSDEHKEKIRLAQLNLPTEVIEKRRILLDKVRNDSKGENNASWKGGISKIGQKLRTTREYIEWRTAIVKRDGFRCKNCGHINVKFEVHHIEPFANYPEKRLDINNGITYCKPCHRDLHKCKIQK